MAVEQPRIYLAGPEVFHPKASALGAEKQRICRAAGLEGIYPLDNALDLARLAKPEQARRIALANEALMRSCDAVIANLTPFRGASMDVGTAFEVGFMRALGRPVFAYSNTARGYVDRCRVYRKAPRLPFDLDRPGLEIEDFDLTENLMIAVAVLESGIDVVVPVGEDGPPALEELGVFSACVARAAPFLGSTADQ
jgi:nucleoside 2-deoxyribosyltransferase